MGYDAIEINLIIVRDPVDTTVYRTAPQLKKQTSYGKKLENEAMVKKLWQNEIYLSDFWPFSLYFGTSFGVAGTAIQAVNWQ